MDTSKLNQTELSYESSAGLAKVNLTNGKLLYEHLDASIGLNSNNINVSHIYNSHFELPTSLNAHMGQNWKLDIQQYLYENDDNTYTYVDSTGINHIFENLTDDEYYDTSGMGLNLKIETNQCTITDLVGNKMTFEEGKLTSIISILNENNTKYIDYDSNKITSICNSVVSIEFGYNKNDYLSKMNVLYYSDELKQYLLEYIIKYVYDEDNKLSYITKESKEGIEKIITMFKYKNEMLEYAVSFIDNNGFKFVFSDDKVTELRTCQANIIAEECIDKKPLLYVGDDIYVGEDNYLGETYNKTVYSLQDEINESNYLSLNSFGYNINNTDVSNEYGVTITYFFDNDKNLVSVFEKDNNNYNMITKNIGINVPLKSDNISTECPCIINGLQIYNYKSSDDIEFSDVIVSDTDDSSQKKTYNITEGQYTFSFWLYLSTSFERKNILLEINKGDECITTATATINPDAVGCWQQVVVSFDVVFDSFDSIKVYFKNKDENSNEENTKNESIDIYLSDVYYYLNSSNKIQLLDGINIEHLIGIDVDNVELTDFKYMTEKDLYMTCYKKALLKENDSSEEVYFPLYYNNGTKAKFVKSAILKSVNDNSKYIIGNDKTFDYKKVSISTYSKTTTETTISLLANSTSEGIFEECFCITKKIIVKGENNIDTHEELEYYDLQNRLILSKNVDSIYQLFNYSENGVEKEVYEKVKKEDNTYEKVTLYKISENYDNDTQTVKEGDKIISLIKYDYKTGLAKNITEYDTLKKEYYYNKYNNILEAIKLYYIKHDNNYNEINYSHINKFINSNGRLVQLMDDKHLYNYVYDLSNLKEECIVSVPDETGVLANKELYKQKYEKTADGYKNIQTNHGYTYTKEYDKYGNIVSELNNGYNISYTYNKEDINKGINKKITKSVIEKANEEKEKIIYEYNENNLCKGYKHIKKCDIITDDQNLCGVLKKEVLYDSMNTTFFTIGNQANYNNVSDEAIISKCILKNSLIMNDKYQKVGETNSEIIYKYGTLPTANIKSVYNYDNLGRIKEKGITIQSYSKTYNLKKQKEFNNNLITKDKYIKLVEDLKEIDLCEYNYEFDENNNLKKIIRSDLSAPGSSSYSRYSYNKYGKLSEEEIALDGTIKKYYYNEDGNIYNVVEENLLDEKYTHIYEYDDKNKDLLTKYSVKNDNDEVYKEIEITYDYYGKILKLTKDDVEREFIWDQGRFLTKVIDPNCEITYKYDYLGRRVSKEFSSGEKVEYFYDGNLLVSENIYIKDYVINLSYMYEQNEVIGFTLYKSFSNITVSGTDEILFDDISYNTIYTYYYVKDILGNITAITDGTDIVVTYNYDAWGNHNFYGTNTAIALLNPFRYRGYLYDVETNLFLVSSRYYSPELCRWISPDDIEYLDPESVNGLNLYCYCLNNPVMCRLGYNLGGVISAPISNIGSISSNVSSRIRSSSARSMSRASASSTPFANVVSMTNYSTTLVDNILFGMALGNISHTTTIQHNNSGVFYAYSNIGNSTSSVGVGLNIKDWYGLNAYVSSNIGIGSSMQLGSITFGAEVSVLDGVSFSLGTVTGNVTNETTVSIGWGTLAFAYAACGAIAATPVPMARAVAAVAVCVVVLIDIFN